MKKDNAIITILFMGWIGVCLLLLKQINISILPGFFDVIERIFSDLSRIEYLDNIGKTVLRVFCGYIVAIFVALPLAVTVNKFQKIFKPMHILINIIKSTPNVIWMPISIMVFSKIEYSVVFLTFLGSFFPIYSTSYSAIKYFPEGYKKTSIFLQMSYLKYLFCVQIPYCMPEIFGGLQQGLSGAWLSVVTAEMINGKNGVGYLTWTCYTLTDYEGVCAGMFVLGALGALSSIILNVVQEQIVFWDKV